MSDAAGAGAAPRGADPTTAGDDPAVHAERALRAYRAMRSTFRGRRGLYRHDARLRPPGSTAHLWPFARALVAVLDLAGMPAPLRAGLDVEASIAEHLEQLERYWDEAGPRPAYASDVAGSRLGGDRYYDDNAWVGLALVELERLRPGRGLTARAAELYRFAAGGWDRRRDAPSPGGVFWVEQGRGLGGRNHDRNTVSNAPNAQLGLHLAELTGSPAGGAGDITPRHMYDWVNAGLNATGEAPGTGLFWDKIRTDGTIDRQQWSYNQGSMIGLNVLLHRAPGAGAADLHLTRADAIARKALAHFDSHHAEQPPAFHAILFRNLLQLHPHTSDRELRRRIRRTLHDYAGHLWAAHRDRRDRFGPGGRPTLLHQSAAVQMLALLAWEPSRYGRLA